MNAGHGGAVIAVVVPVSWWTQNPLPKSITAGTWVGKPWMAWSRATVLARPLPRQVRSFQ